MIEIIRQPQNQYKLTPKTRSQVAGQPTLVSSTPRQCNHRAAKFCVWKKIHGAGDTVELNLDEVVVPKAAVGAPYTHPVVMGTLFALLDGEVAAPI